MKRNLTIQLDDQLIQKARVVAAKRSTSISRMVASELKRTVEADEAYSRTKAKALRQLQRPFRMGGGKLPTREELHAR